MDAAVLVIIGDHQRILMHGSGSLLGPRSYSLITPLAPAWTMTTHSEWKSLGVPLPGSMATPT